MEVVKGRMAGWLIIQANLRYFLHSGLNNEHKKFCWKRKKPPRLFHILQKIKPQDTPRFLQIPAKTKH